MRAWLNSFGSLIDRIICVVVAVIFLQAPVLMNQYQNVLAGAQVEASRTYERLEEIALRFDQSVEDFLAELLADDNPKVVANAEADQEQVDRYRWYSEALTAFADANAFTRPMVFFQYLDPQLLDAVVFQPGLPLTVEGFVYALLGIVLAMGVISLVKRLFRRKNSPETIA